MPLVQGSTAPTFTLPHATFTGLASPSRGSSETSVWRVVLSPGAEPMEHSLTREEIFVAVSGAAVATVDGESHAIAAGDALVVPAGKPFSIANPHSDPFEAVTVFPVGGQAAMPGGEPFTPPWAE
ncbi:MAG TPA: cupin domain-containing protein [Micromonosporaceae bacterium]|nr:cupin domain-containing protein [Micromonosporaceae bacterium]HCU49136.1 cupin domain-containing protein [Micromonosporaceae bacterium]